MFNTHLLVSKINRVEHCRADSSAHEQISSLDFNREDFALPID
jgi:hypothetical protein